MVLFSRSDVPYRLVDPFEEFDSERRTGTFRKKSILSCSSYVFFAFMSERLRLFLLIVLPLSSGRCGSLCCILDIHCRFCADRSEAVLVVVVVVSKALSNSFVCRPVHVGDNDCKEEYSGKVADDAEDVDDRREDRFKVDKDDDLDGDKDLRLLCRRTCDPMMGSPRHFV